MQWPLLNGYCLNASDGNRGGDPCQETELDLKILADAPDAEAVQRNEGPGDGEQADDREEQPNAAIVTIVVRAGGRP